MTAALAGALECAGIGIPTFPVWGVKDGTCRCPKRGRCESPGKHPMVTGWQKVATANMEQIRTWANTYDGCNFGIPCGSRTGIAVIECDPYQGGWLRDIPVRPTVISLSGRGFHCFYKTNGTPIQGGDKKFGPGLGLRAEGHFVFAPGSLHVNGKRYGRHRWGWENFAHRPVLEDGGDPRTPTPTRIAGPLPDKLPEGQRHSSLVSLAGSMRRRGSTAEAIFAALAVENKTRCDPPLGDEEVYNIALDIAGRYEPATKNEPEVEDADEERRPVVKPTRTLDECIPGDGFVCSVVESAKRDSMVPPEFAVAMALTQCAALLQSRVMYELGPRTWGMSIWCELIAKPGQKKSTSLGYLAPLRRIDPEGELAPLVTREAMGDELALRRDRYQIHTEFAQFMQETETKSYYSGVRDAMNDLWDGSEFVKLPQTRKDGARQFRYPSLTLAGATTLSHVHEWASSAAVLRGFMTRILFVRQETDVRYVGLGDGKASKGIAVLTEHLRELQALVNRTPLYGIGTYEPRLLQFTPDAQNMIQVYDRSWTERQVPSYALDGFKERLGAYAIRLAGAYALSLGRLEVDKESARLGIAFTEYNRERMWPLIEDYFSTDTWQAKQIARLQQHYDGLATQTTNGWVNVKQLSDHAKFFGEPFRDTIGFMVETDHWEERELPAKGAHGGKPSRWVRDLRREWA